MQATPERTEAPRVRAVIHGALVCKRAASACASALHGDKESRELFCSGDESEPGTMRVDGGRRGTVSVYSRENVCVWVCVCVVGPLCVSMWREREMGKPKLMLECVC